MKKVCSKCDDEKDVKEFNSSKSTEDKLSSWCKTCVRKRSKEYYKNNKSLHNTRVKKYKDNVRKFVNLYKSEQKCQKCGEDKHYLLDFHHLNPDVKEFDVSAGTSIELRNKEIAKCIVLCSNHHREFHYLEKLEGITIQEYMQ